MVQWIKALAAKTEVEFNARNPQGGEESTRGFPLTGCGMCTATYQ